MNQSRALKYYFVPLAENIGEGIRGQGESYKCPALQSNTKKRRRGIKVLHRSSGEYTTRVLTIQEGGEVWPNMENPEHVLMELNSFEKEPQDNLPEVRLIKMNCYS